MRDMDKKTFISRIHKQEGACWIWRGRISEKGYGTYGKRLAHRIAYEMWVAAIPSGLNVCHSCDNPPCVRPDHLFLGTNADNTKDMMSKGRGKWNSGGKNCNAKLTIYEVRRIRLNNQSANSLAKEFGVSARTVQLVRDGVTWKTI